ncbi:alpha/beta hydrolase [Streptomyces sp. NPDC001970]
MPDYVFPSEEPVFQPAAREFAEATASPPFPVDLGSVQGHEALEEAQSGELDKPEVDENWVAVSGGPKGSVAVRILRPKGVVSLLPAVLYVHGAGWDFDSGHTHDRLVRELAVGARATLVFPDYMLSPEARYPIALEECYAVARWVTSQGANHGIDPTRLAVAGDLVGGNMCAVLTLLAKERGDVSFIQQVLFYPVTDANFDTCSCHQSAEGYFARRDAATASPLRVTEHQLTGLPPALVITAEAGVLRDEGEAYAAKLRAAGVAVTAARCGGTVHDCATLNALPSTHAARGAIAQAVATLRQAFGTDV